MATSVAIPAAHAQETLTGMFRLTRQTTEIVEPAVADVLDEIIARDEELQWQVYVPENYDAERPAGLFVFIDPDGHGRMPEEWQSVFTRHNMIWVSARRTQRRRDEMRPVWKALLGSRAIAKDYAIDLQRMYVGGAEETVRTAINTMLMANEFAGAVYVRGSFYSDQLTPDQQQAMRRKAHVFVTGTNDKGKAQIRSDYEAYRESGFTNTKLIFEMQRLGAMPDPGHMNEAILFLDARLRR